MTRYLVVVTNAYGTNITLITLTSSINPNPGPILYSVAANQLTLSWPTNLGVDAASADQRNL